MHKRANITTPTLQEIAMSKKSGRIYDKSELKKDTVATTGIDSRLIKIKSFFMANFIFSFLLSISIFKSKLTRLESPIPKIKAFIPINRGKIKIHKNRKTSPAR